MKMADFLRQLRGKITGLNAISARFDILQARLDGLINSNSDNFQLIKKLQANIERMVATPAIAEQSYAGDIVLNSQFNENVPRSISSNNISDSNKRAFSELRASSLINVLPGEKIRLVFLVIAPETWPSLESVWKRAKNDDRFVASVVVLKNANPNIALSALAKSQAMFESKGVPYFTEQTFSLDTFRPHVVFTTIPYECLYPQSFKPDQIVAKGSRIAYVSYGLQVLGGVFLKRYSYDTEVPRLAWRIFARSQSHFTNFGRYCSYGNGHVVVTGHPRIESYSSERVPLFHPASQKAQGRLVVLWNPHHTVLTRRKCSTFLDNHETIIQLIDERPNLFLLLRPHPLLQAALAKLENWGAERVATWFKRISEKDNVYLDTETDYRPAFEISSAFLTDAGSFLTEYLHTGKPICHLTGSDDIGLSEEARGLACFYPGANKAEIADFLDRVSRGDDPMLEPRRLALHSYFGPENQSPSKIILDVIANELGSFAPRAHSTDWPSPSSHKEAPQSWTKGPTTFLALTENYQRMEQTLRNILNRHATGRFAVDIQCGNGLFTEILKDFFEFTEAIDSNEQLISEALESAKCKGVSNVSYTVERLDHAESLTTYDFVCCLGLTSKLVDDEEFIKTIWKLKAAMRPGAKLLIGETLNLSATELVEYDSYKAVYRDIAEYLRVFEITGLSLLEELVISEYKETGRTNRLFVFAEALK